MKLTLRTALFGATILAAGTALAQDNPMVGGAAMFADRNIVENAVNSADHTTLVAAVQAAGLVETLQGDGPFTVFAPVNAAFDALPAGTVETLLMPENIDALTQVLTCHVIGAAATSDMIASMIMDANGSHSVETLGGCVLQAQANGDMITLTDETGGVATVTIADVMQSNGVIHVIDRVLLPAAAPAEEAAAPMPMNDNPMVGGAAMFADRNIVENAVNSADHTTLVAAVQAAGLVETLQGEGPFTVFAPTNAAFDALPDGTVETLLMEENRDTLVKVLTSHVVARNLSADDLISWARASNDGFYHFRTVSGAALSAQVQPSGALFIYDESGNAYRVSIADVNQSNGVIHVVDGVLLPR
jgi:transforming growth factor-beta-induced protein